MQPHLDGTAAKNFKLVIEYDGTAYHGWQRQPNGPTIQQEIEAAIGVMIRRPVTLTGSGRTDAGVHARGQVANFSCPTKLSAKEFHQGLNSILPDDIVIRDCRQVPAQFHARFDARSKIYRYTIVNQPLRPAIGRQYVWWLRAPLDLASMQQAAELIRGEHDFESFQGAGSPRPHTRRHILRADWTRASGNRLLFDIQADGFLRYMVRNIVGTLVAVGWKKTTPEEFAHILTARDRGLAAATAPACGLQLLRVIYE